VRSRLTLWYGAVLVATLLVFGLVLHFTLQSLITRPAAGFLNATADLTASRWQEAPATCPRPRTTARPGRRTSAAPRPPRRPLYIARLDHRAGARRDRRDVRICGRLPEVFLRPSLVLPRRAAEGD
jgi:hypothetical protein